MRIIIGILSLALFWMILLDKFTVSAVIVGLFIGTICIASIKILNHLSEKGNITENDAILPSSSFLSYISWIILEMINSTIAITKIVWNIDHNTTDTFITVFTKSKKNFHTMAISASVTFTPGTITIAEYRDQKGEKYLIIHSILGDVSHDIDTRLMKRILRKAWYETTDRKFTEIFTYQDNSTPPV